MARFQTTRDSGSCFGVRVRGLNPSNYSQPRELGALSLHWNIDVFVYGANFCRQPFFAYIVLL